MKSRKALEKIKQILSDYKEYTPYIQKIESELNQLDYLRDKFNSEQDRHYGEKQWHLQIINDLKIENEKIKFENIDLKKRFEEEQIKVNKIIKIDFILHIITVIILGILCLIKIYIMIMEANAV